jgi:hypothetical protein
MNGVSTEALEEGLELFADAVRLAITIGDRPAADTVTRHAEAVVGESAVPHRRATALHCRGLLDGDPAALLAAAQQYRVAGRPLPEAQALEAAATALAGSGETSRAAACLADAVSLYTHLGAEWDLGRIHA